jgi:hypothetical protein
MEKKYFFIRYQIKGRTYYKNQDGKRVSAQKVKTGRRKIYELVQREIKGPDGTPIVKSGELLDRKKAKAKKVKEPDNRKLPVQNIFIQREILSNQNKGRDIYTKVNGKTYKHESKESQANVILFNYEVNEAFYKRLKGKVESPIFVLSTIQSRKDNLLFIDYDSIQLDEGVKDSKLVLKAFIQFKNDVKTLRSKYFGND